MILFKRAFTAAAIFAAVFSLRAASPLESTQANVQFNLALNLYNSGKLEASAETLKKALKAVPEHPQANLLLGLIRNQQGNFREAVNPLKAAAKASPENFDAFNNLGIALYQLKDNSGAEAAFSRAAEIKPGRPDVLINLGVLELSQKKWKSAQATFGKAAAASSGDSKSASKSWAGVAEAAQKAGDAAAELEALKKMLQLEPDNHGVRLGLAQKYYRAEQNEEASQVLEPLKDKGDSEAEFLLGCVLYRKGHFDESRARFEAALKIRPDYPEARFNLAITLYDQNKFEEAIDQFAEVLKKHPQDEQAKNNLEITRRAAVRGFLKAGSQDFLKGEYLAAMEKWRTALKLEKDNKVIKDLVETAQAQLKLQAAEFAGKGDLALQSGKTEEAVSAWSQALECDPENAEAKAGMEKVRPEASKLADIYNRNFDAMMSEGDLVKAGDFARRLATFDKGRGQLAMKAWEAKSASKLADLSNEADAAAHKGDLGLAVEKFEAAARLKKDDASLGLRLNQAKANLRAELTRVLKGAKDAEEAKNFPKALKGYRRVLELEAGNGDALGAVKRLAKAAKVKSADPAELDEWYYQGVYAYAAGDTKKAMAFWGKVLSADPNHQLSIEAVNRANKRLKALSNVN